MPRIDEIETKIYQLERFKVRIKSDIGADIRGDRVVTADFRDWVRASAGSMTVTEWKRVRFSQRFSFVDVDVLHASGQVAHGRTTLETVRSSY